ncbi:hypothetical protein F5Y19DRAFT_475122 [Xylariaceae sp. FL1651]|nr:hypothetical protein F5Y19DRAFT_475122 [Xylariaceae sp. FL1651]
MSTYGTQLEKRESKRGQPSKEQSGLRHYRSRYNMRRHNSRDNDDDDDDDDDRRDRDKGSRRAPSSAESSLGRRLACPFYKYDPKTHRHPSCLGPGWDTVFRVKEHIYRRHTLEHHSSDPGVGVTPEVMSTLKARSRYKTGQTEAEKWIQIYQIIFPDASPIPSPYCVQESNFDEFRQYMRKELPSIISAELGQTSLPTSEASLAPFVHQCFESTFRAYEQEHTQLAQPFRTPPWASREPQTMMPYLDPGADNMDDIFLAQPMDSGYRSSNTLDNWGYNFEIPLDDFIGPVATDGQMSSMDGASPDVTSHSWGSINH